MEMSVPPRLEGVVKNAKLRSKKKFESVSKPRKGAKKGKSTD